MKLISQIWRGGLGSVSYSGINNEELRNVDRLVKRNYKALEEKLNSDGKEALEKYSQCMEEFLDLASEQAFCDGFCLGTGITAEALLCAEQAEKNA